MVVRIEDNDAIVKQRGRESQSKVKPWVTVNQKNARLGECNA